VFLSCVIYTSYRMRYEKHFIAIEGIDGCGKGTQIELLKKHFLERQRKDVVFTYEPTRDGEWGKKIQEIINSPQPAVISAEKLQLLYTLDRKDHLERIILPALKKGNTVFCDRYFLSTLAYGSIDKTLHWKTLMHDHEQILGDEFILPAKTILIDVDPDIASPRIDARGEQRSYFETLEKQRMIRQAYLSLGSHFDGFCVVDGSGDSGDVFSRVSVHLSEYL